jgi:hypothetical protein
VATILFAPIVLPDDPPSSISISKYPKMASKVFLFFRAVAVRISVRAPRRQNGRHFAWPVKVLTYKWNFANPKKVPES